MQKHERAPRSLPATPQTLAALRIDPAVIERHLTVAVPAHCAHTTNRAICERYLRLHLDRIIPLAHPSPIRKAS